MKKICYDKKRYNKGIDSMRKYGMFLVLSIILFPGIIKAADCSDQTISNYSKILGNVTYTYQYKESNKKVSFDITLLNVPQDFYVRDDYHDNFSVSKGTDVKFTSFKPHDTYKFEIFPDINSCPTIEPQYVYVTLPGYNPYYSDPLCKGLENYQYCNRWYANSLSYKQFVTQLTNYRKKEEQSEVKERVDKTDNLSYIIDFYQRYYMIILPVIIISIIGYIIYHNRRDDSLISVK